MPTDSPIRETEGLIDVNWDAAGVVVNAEVPNCGRIALDNRLTPTATGFAGCAWFASVSTKDGPPTQAARESLARFTANHWHGHTKVTEFTCVQTSPGASRCTLGLRSDRSGSTAQAEVRLMWDDDGVVWQIDPSECTGSVILC